MPALSKRRILTTAALSAALFAFTACKDKAAVITDTPMTKSQSFNPDQIMVAAADPRAVTAGLKALERGGTAIDAAIAVQSVLGLVEPQSSGIAGGAFLIFYDKSDGSVTMYDGRETAPMAATESLFMGEDGKRLPYVQGIASGKSTGVPGAVAMLHMAHSEHGALGWGEGFTAAIDLAEDGFEVTPRFHQSLQRAARFGLLNQQQAARDYFFQADGKTPIAVGYKRVNKPYAQTLRAIAADYRALYEGDIPKAIIAATQQEPRPGVLALSDFESYAPKKREALCSSYRVYKVCGPQPPSSGGVATQAILRILENFDMAQYGPDSVTGWHLFAEASRLAYADRDLFVGDDDFVDVPIGPMLDAAYLKSRAGLISEGSAMDTVRAGDPIGFKPGADDTPDSPGTSHMSILDGYGNALAMTTTVEAGFGSQRMAAGMILNNQLTDFSFSARDANGNLLANSVAPGKRPRSSMSPTLVFDRHGEFKMATGSPGGNSIIAYTAKTLVGVLDWGMSPQEAANISNLIARGNRLKIERDFIDPSVIEGLQALGHDVTVSDGEASGIHIILRMEDGQIIGGADPRREGVAWTLEDLKAQSPESPDRTDAPQ